MMIRSNPSIAFAARRWWSGGLLHSVRFGHDSDVLFILFPFILISDGDRLFLRCSVENKFIRWSLKIRRNAIFRFFLLLFLN